MSLRNRSCLFVFLAAAVLAPLQAQGESNAVRAETRQLRNQQVPYVIGTGDVLQVTVWKEPDASIPAVIVRSDGIISLPLLREMHVAGMTPQQLEDRITESLSSIIRSPEVSVIVKEVHSEKVYLIGAVRKEGPISMASRMTVLQALAEAGGITDYAKTTKIYVLRNEMPKPQRIPFNYRAALKGDPSSIGIVLQPGDTIVVP